MSKHALSESWLQNKSTERKIYLLYQLAWLELGHGMCRYDWGAAKVKGGAGGLCFRYLFGWEFVHSSNSPDSKCVTVWSFQSRQSVSEMNHLGVALTNSIHEKSITSITSISDTLNAYNDVKTLLPPCVVIRSLILEFGLVEVRTSVFFLKWLIWI